MTSMDFKELKTLYEENFNISNISQSDKHSAIENRMMLISLICYVTFKTKAKHPDTTYYEIVLKLASSIGLPDEFLKGLAIMCENFGKYCTDFPTFGLKGQEIVTEIKSILKTYLPF